MISDKARLMTLIPAWVDGVLTPVEKLETHKKGLKHKAVSVFVLDGSDLLIQRRARHKYHTPGLWANTCCTHPFWGEDPVDCANRRLNEELGIGGVETVFKDQIEYRAAVGNGMIEHEVVDLFVAHAQKRSLTVSPNPDEVDDTKWVDIHALALQVQEQPNNYTPWLKIYLSDHLDRVLR